MISTVFPLAILAGGLATRLRPLTATIPKSLLEVEGEPFIAHQLRLLRSRGLERIVICAGYLGEQIRDYVGVGERFGLDVQYSFDGPQLLGTAGALRRAQPLLSERFQVLYGDSYLDCDYLAVQSALVRAECRALMTVYRNEGQHDTSNVEYAGGQIVAYDKRRSTARMRHIDYGLGVLSTAALNLVPADRLWDLADLYGELLARGELAAYEMTERFYEIGSPAGLEDTRRLLRGQAMLKSP